MMGRRRRVLYCIGGVLAILLVAGAWYVRILQQHYAALEVSPEGEQQGAEGGSAMAHAIDDLDAAAERALEPNADEPAVRRAAGEALGAFERNLATVRGRIAPPGPEGDRAVAAIAGAWARYAVALDMVLDQYKPRGERQEALGVLAAESPRIRQAVREIEALDRRPPADRGGEVRQVIRVAIVAGAVLAALFVIVLSVRLRRSPQRERPRPVRSTH